MDDQVKPGHTYYYYLEDVDLAGKRRKSDVIQITIAESPRSHELESPSAELPVPAPTPLAEQQKAEPDILPIILPMRNSLLANYPNPFNPETWIPFHLSDQAMYPLGYTTPSVNW